MVLFKTLRNGLNLADNEAYSILHCSDIIDAARHTAPLYAWVHLS